MGTAAAAARLRPLGLLVTTLFLVAVPVLGLFVHVALAWRLGHHRTRTWTRQEPAWGRVALAVASVVGAVSWTSTIARVLKA